MNTSGHYFFFTITSTIVVGIFISTTTIFFSFKYKTYNLRKNIEIADRFIKRQKANIALLEYQHASKLTTQNIQQMLDEQNFHYQTPKAHQILQVNDIDSLYAAQHIK